MYIYDIDKFLKEKIDQCKSIHKGKYSYDKVVYVNYDTDVIITCPIHGDFEKNLYSHSVGRGCKKCSGEKLSKQFRKGRQDFIDTSSNIHNNKYSYNKVSNNFKLRDKVIITCPIHGDFEQVAFSHKIGSGCPRCKNKLYSNEENIISKISKFNVKLKDIPKGMLNKIKIKLTCPIHGDFEKNYSQISKGQVCGKCLKHRNRLNISSKQINQMYKAHNNRFEYIGLPEIVEQSTLLKIRCKEHNHTFELKKECHVNSKYGGCYFCIKQYKKTKKLNFSDLLNRFNIVHKGKYSYDKVVYKGLNNKITITCPIHGDFEQLPFTHQKGSDCPRCKDSIGEKIIQDILKKMNIEYEPQKSFYGCLNKETSRPLLFDIYVPEFHTCIEFDGHHHFIPIDWWGGEQGLIDTQNRDRIKNEYCKNNEINLIRIPYDMGKSKIVDLLNKCFNKNLVIDVKKRNKWIDINVKERIKKYNTRSELIQKDYGLYSYCKKNNLWNHVCDLISSKTKRYTYEYAKEITSKYEIYNLFVKENEGLNKYILKNNFLELIEHLYKQKTYRTDQEILEELKKYKYKIDVRNNDYALFSVASKRKLLDGLGYKTLHWNNQMVIDVFKKSKSKKELRIKYRGAENYSRKHGFYDEYIEKYLNKPHM